MAPSFNNLREDDGNDSEDELDTSGGAGPSSNRPPPLTKIHRPSRTT